MEGPANKARRAPRRRVLVYVARAKLRVERPDLAAEAPRTCGVQPYGVRPDPESQEGDAGPHPVQSRRPVFQLQAELRPQMLLSCIAPAPYAVPVGPEEEEIVKRYEELTGWKVENLLYNEVLATFRYGGTVISVLKKFIKDGVPIEEDMIVNNWPTQHLADLLGLPSPGEKRQEYTDINEVTATIQFHLTGPGGSDWYLLWDKGKGSRHDGVAENPNCVIKASLEDWKAIQAGEINRLDAWSEGRLVTDGDLGLMGLLEEVINEFAES